MPGESAIRCSRSALFAVVSVALIGCTPERVDEAATEDAPVETATLEAEASPEAYRGAGLARQVCAQCHHVTGGEAPVGLPAESFVEIANRPGTSIASLEGWMRSDHPSMPNFIFSESDVRDVAVYIHSLRSAE